MNTAECIFRNTALSWNSKYPVDTDHFYLAMLLERNDLYPDLAERGKGILNFDILYAACLSNRETALECFMVYPSGEEHAEDLIKKLRDDAVPCSERILQILRDAQKSYLKTHPVSKTLEEKDLVLVDPGSHQWSVSGIGTNITLRRYEGETLKYPAELWDNFFKWSQKTARWENIAIGVK